MYKYLSSLYCELEHPFTPTRPDSCICRACVCRGNPYSQLSGKRKFNKNRVTFNQNLFSFLTEGQKVVSYAQKYARIDASQFLLLSSGNCLMTEKLISEQGGYSSTLLFFDNKVLTDFFLKYADLFTHSSGKKSSTEPFVV